MNVYEAMRIVRNEFVPHTIDAHLAMDEIEQVADAYDALTPDWSNAPDDSVRWYAIDANGAATWSDEEPFFSSAGKFPETFWDVNGDYYVVEAPVTLPIGIDWRLCKWHRPEVTA